MSCVRACARFGCLVRSGPEISSGHLPFSLFVAGCFPFSLESPPLPPTSYPTLVGLIGIYIYRERERKSCLAQRVRERERELQSRSTFQGSCMAMTRDHKPDLKDERARLENAVGRVVFDGYANQCLFVQSEYAHA